MNKGLYFINPEKYANMSTSELWEKKTKVNFFTWIFMFLIAVLAINGITIAQICFFFIDKESLRSSWNEINPEYSQAFESIWRGDVIDVFVTLIIQLTVLVSLSISIYKCIIEKSFKFISFLPTLFIFFQVFYSFFSLIRYAISGANLMDSFKVSWVYVLQFVMMFVYPFIWFFISRNVGVIRRISFNAEMREQMMRKMDSVMNEFGGAEFSGVNPFGVDPSSMNNHGSDTNQNSFNTNDAFYLKLKSLSRDQLNDIAKKLSISGYESMSDNELIKIIADIRNVQNKDNKEKEFELRSKDDNDKDNEDKVN